MTPPAASVHRTRRCALRGRAAVSGVLLLAGLAALPAHALYKVVNPDGTITYTDRPPTAAPNARVTPLNRRGMAGPAPSADAALPAELRQAMQRHPVTLFTAPDCRPCDAGRRFLQQRGVPYTEKRADSEEDAVALERRVGGRTVPALLIGSQPLRGFAEADWAVYLDAAGYPRESRLPRGWTFPAATTLVERSERPAPPAGTAAPTPPATAPEPTPEPAAEPATSTEGEPAAPIRF